MRGPLATHTAPGRGTWLSVGLLFDYVRSHATFALMHAAPLSGPPPALKLLLLIACPGLAPGLGQGRNPMHAPAPPPAAAAD
jgi:hypothetical protein